MVVLLLLSFQKMICVSNWLFWSVRKECYTVDKSGLKHRERQNSQSWAHKLHWCGIIWSFACGASLLPVLYSPSHHSSYPELTSNCTVFCQAHYIVYFFCFCLVACTYLVFSCLTLCVSCLCSLAVFWTLKCSACSLEGEWLLTTWSDRLTITQIWAAVLFCGMQPWLR